MMKTKLHLNLIKIIGWQVWTLLVWNQSIKIPFKLPKLMSQQIIKREYKTSEQSPYNQLAYI